MPKDDDHSHLLEREAGGIEHVEIRPIDVNRLQVLLGAEEVEAIEHQIERAWTMVQRRTIWNINSTARGGGVAEMLQPMLSYCLGLGLDVRWLVIPGREDFFEVTKRLHNHLHCSPGDGGPLGDAERQIYESVLAPSAEECANLIDPGDFVICHDPQTAGLLPELARRGAHVVWRCHIGHDAPDELARTAWKFLMPDLLCARGWVFSREAYIPEGLDRERCFIIRPSIDPLSAKNQPLSEEAIAAILTKSGLVSSDAQARSARFTREDGTVSTIENAADMIHTGGLPTLETSLIVQVSRWDHLKDPVGVLQAYARHLADGPGELMLAGPNVSAVADDPEGGRVLDEVEAAWRELPRPVRQRVSLACLPMKDLEENAAIVNALQRHADVVVQKSLYEGFGLTVTEAMWKSRPVVASAVGGIQDQIEDGVSGLLVADPGDLQAFADAVARLLGDVEAAERMGERAHRRVREHFLFVRHLFQYAELFERMANGRL
jgi:trehalose synthase